MTNTSDKMSRNSLKFTDMQMELGPQLQKHQEGAYMIK